jgi:glycosyltransferase involved in cell wall biosynthesis
VTGPETGSEGGLLDGREGSLDVVYVPHLVRSINPAFDARATAELYQIFRRMKPDIVHTHSSKAGVLGRIAARAARVPLVVHTLHSLVYHDYQPALVNFTYRNIKRTLVPLTDFYVSVSDNIRDRAIAARIGSPERHATVRSGFLTDEFVAQLIPRPEARARFGLPDDRVIVGCVARLFPLKGHAEILEAARRLVRRQPDVLFAFVGSGPLQPELERTVRQYGLENNVRFLGRVTPEEIPAVLSAFDILAHASLREGLARVIPQGVLAGLPVVCYDLDGSGEVVTDGFNGFLVAPRDTAAFADRLETLVTDAALRETLGGRGREAVREEFSVAEMVRQLDELYRRLLAGPVPTSEVVGGGSFRASA